MKQRLPVGGFRWVADNDLQSVVNKIMNAGHPDFVGEDSDVGYILECDLQYPSSIHDRHSGLPLCPQKVKIVESMLSNYCREFFDDKNKFVSSEKLVPNLHDKTNYVLHYRNLQLYIELGMVLTKTHRILEFRQKRWMNDYIDLNTNHRRLAKSAFEKDYFKLANNAVYGEFIGLKPSNKII